MKQLEATLRHTGMYLPERLKDKGRTPTKNDDDPRTTDKLKTQIKAFIKFEYLKTLAIAMLVS